MFVEIDPGSNSRAAGQGGLDAPDPQHAAGRQPRRDPLRARHRHARLPQAAGQRRRPGPEERGGDLQEVFARFEPTYRDIAKVTAQVQTRRREPAPADQLAPAAQHRAGQPRRRPRTARRPRPPCSAPSPRRTQNISRAVPDFPRALRQTTDTLGKVQTYAEHPRPDGRHACARPSRALTAPTTPFTPFAKEADADPAQRRSARSCATRGRSSRDLKRRPRRPGQRHARPDAQRSRVLNHLFNLFAYNPGGREGPDKAGREEGYLFWLAWLDAPDGRRCSRPATPTAPTARVRSAAPCGRAVRAARACSPSSGILSQRSTLGHDLPGQRSVLADAEAGTLPRPASSRWCSSRCRASGCCCSCGCPSAARSRSSRRATASRSRSPRPRSSASRPTSAWPACRSARCAAKDARPARATARSPRSSSTAGSRRCTTTRKAILRQKTLLGETYVELTPGTRQRRRSPRTARCATRQVSRRSQLDEIFQAFDPQTRAGVPGLAAGAGQGRSTGRGQDLNDALGNLPALRHRRHRRARRSSTPRSGRPAAPGPQHRRGVRRADPERGRSCTT